MLNDDSEEPLSDSLIVVRAIRGGAHKGLVSDERLNRAGDQTRSVAVHNRDRERQKETQGERIRDDGGS